MGHGAQPQFIGFANCGFIDFRTRAKKLNAIRALFRNLLHPFSGILWRGNFFSIAHAKAYPGRNTWCGYSVVFAEFLMAERPVKAVKRTRFANGGNAMCKPE